MFYNAPLETVYVVDEDAKTAYQAQAPWSDFGTMNRKDFCELMSFRVEFGCIVAMFGRYH